MVTPEDAVDQLVGEGGTVLAHGRALEDDPILDIAGKVLFFYAGLNIARGIADLEPPVVGRVVYVLIGVDGWGLGDSVAEKVLCWHKSNIAGLLEVS